jgi:hypothetical protein
LKDPSKKAARLNKMHMPLTKPTTDKIRRNPESQIFCGLVLVFVVQQKPLKVLVDDEIARWAHLNISQKVFVDRFL